ncbi:hypothetical protein AV530_016812 [Patagioenas fasciata monilis]|uniref:Uncharacterized protein n=1 Tax=Patagioenas fasciata monilis TaxID=372326 RepID=A0A1V4J475_PATFA|nr:hypothetical protein AV530_016812 [Patagioenas fasciata monilis]
MGGGKSPLLRFPSHAARRRSDYSSRPTLRLKGEVPAGAARKSAREKRRGGDAGSRSPPAVALSMVYVLEMQKPCSRKL